MSQALERIVLHHLEGSRAGQVDSFTQPVVVVGRAPDCHLVLSSDKGVSGKHCEIRQANGQFEVVDTNSTNGTFVGDERITAQALKNGDTIRFGWMGPMVKVELEEAVRAVHAGHPGDAQSTVMVSARRIQQAAAGETPVPLPKEPAITMPPPSRAPAPPPVADAAPRPVPVAAPAPAPSRAAPPPRPAAAPAAGAWTTGRWAVSIALVSAVAVFLAVAVWLVIR